METSYDNSNWIFILGDTSSGTTLLMYFLGMHPEINRMYGEGQNYTYNTGDYLKETGENHKRLFTEIEDVFKVPRRPVEDIKNDWNNFLMTDNGKYNLEKSPVNVLRIKWIIENFNEPYIIGIIRNGYSNVNSICARHRNKEDPDIIDDETVERASIHWSKVYSIIFRDTNNYDKFFMITYEDLVENPENTLNNIIRFIGIDTYDWSFVKDHYVEKIKYLNGLHEGRIENKNKHPRCTFNKNQIDIIRENASCILDMFNYEPTPEMILNEYDEYTMK